MSRAGSTVSTNVSATNEVSHKTLSPTIEADLMQENTENEENIYLHIEVVPVRLRAKIYSNGVRKELNNQVRLLKEIW